MLMGIEKSGKPGTPYSRTEMPVKTQKVILPVRGTTCVSCVNRIQKALNQLPGVIHAAVNFGTEKATVTAVLGQVRVEDLVRAIESVGYRIPEIQESSKPSK
jgi:copper chaperone CopZ